MLHSLFPAQSIFVLWVLASVFADLIGSTALCPLEATRIRLVTDPTFARGTIDGMSRVSTRINGKNLSSRTFKIVISN